MSETFVEYVTAMIGGQLFGLPISRVNDVFVPASMTRVPLAQSEVAGLINMRGRIVTVIDMRRRLDLAAQGRASAWLRARAESASARARGGDGRPGGELSDGAPSPVAERPPAAIGIEHNGESYGLLIDEIGEVMRLSSASREENPVNMDHRLAQVAIGVYRLDGRILVVLDVDRVLDFESNAKAA
jgi:purine-binding chemotaxis protein CheW